MLDYTTRKKAQRITRVVADYFRVTVDDLIAPRGQRYASSPMFHRPRRLAMFLMRKDGMSFPQIGEFFNRNHTTAIQACRNAEEEDSNLVAELQHKLESASNDGTTETCPNCQRLALEIAEMKLQVLEMKMRFGCE